jgi:hypothetical protein
MKNNVNLEIDNNFTGVSTTINNEGNLKTYFLGQNFINGIAAVLINREWGFINGKGKEICEIKWKITK